MIGGIVVGVARGAENTLVNVEDTTYGSQTLAIRVIEKESEKIGIGDSIWWHSRKAYWTPKRSKIHDIPLQRIGYSH